MDLTNGFPNEVWIVFIKRSRKSKTVSKANYKIVSDYSEGYTYAMEELKKPENQSSAYYVEKFKHQPT